MFLIGFKFTDNMSSNYVLSFRLNCLFETLKITCVYDKKMRPNKQ